MKEWNIPVTWTVFGKVKVTADTLIEAMKIARDDEGVLPLPTESDYVDGSWELSEEDVEGQKKREAALAAVERVVQDGRRRFSSFKADTQDQYRKTINAFISAVLPVWVQYRNTYVNV